MQQAACSSHHAADAACLQGALAGAAAFALGTLFVLYKLIYGQPRTAAAARAPRAKRD